MNCKKCNHREYDHETTEYSMPDGDSILGFTECLEDDCNCEMFQRIDY